MKKRKTRPPLTPKRKEWAEARGEHTFYGKPLHYPIAPEERYKGSMQMMVNQMTKAYEREMRAVFNELGDVTQDASLASQARIRLSKLSKRFNKLFRDGAPTTVERMFGQVNKASSSTLKNSLKELSGGITLKTDIMPATLKEMLTASTAENVGLIKSIPQQYHDQIQGAVMRSIQPGGKGMADVTKALDKYKNIAGNRVKLIAEDQTRKITSAMNVERNKALGIKKFEWRHSGGSAEPRKLHLELDGQIFSYDKPPIINRKTGARGFPGQEIHCKCFSVPVLEFGED